MNKELFSSKNFNDDSGKMLVTSLKTNSKYVIEPIHNNKTQVWTYVGTTPDLIEQQFKNKSNEFIEVEYFACRKEGEFLNILSLPIKYDIFTWLEKFEELSGQPGEFILINPEDLVDKNLLNNLNLKVSNG